jgi:uncharacterized RDD family membrane protein YckC
MKAYDLYIIDSTNGEKPSIVSVINRYIFTIVSIIFIFTMLIPFFNKSKKTLQDYISGTIIKDFPNKQDNLNT